MLLVNRNHGRLISLQQSTRTASAEKDHGQLNDAIDRSILDLTRWTPRFRNHLWFVDIPVTWIESQ